MTLRGLALAALVAIAAPLLGAASHVALAKGSCCSHPSPLVLIQGSTDFPLTQPGEVSKITVSVLVDQGSVSGPIQVPSGGPFSLVSTTCLVGSTRCTATFGFKPTEGGDYSSQFSVLAANQWHPGDGFATLVGQGYGANYAWQAPVALSVLDGAAGSATMQLRSTGQTSLHVSKVTLTPTSGDLSLGADSCAKATVAPGHSCSITLRYDALPAESEGCYVIAGDVTVTVNSATVAVNPATITACPPSDSGN